MSETTFDVLAIGNAIVDVIARCEDDFLVSESIAKGAMNLIDMDRAEALYKVMGPAIETSGGSAGNTAAGIASFGGKVFQDRKDPLWVHLLHIFGYGASSPSSSTLSLA